MFKVLVIALSACGLAACAEITPSQFSGPNGGTAYSMKCSGMGRTLDKCFVKAGELCPGGYQIISQTSGTVIVPVQGGFVGAPNRNLAIECKH